MRKIVALLLLSFASVCCFASAEQETPRTSPNSPSYDVLEVQEKILTLQKENIDDKISHHQERIEDLHKNLNIFLIGLTVLTAILTTVAGYWMNKKAKSLQDDFNNQEKLINEKLKLLDKSIELAEGKVSLFQDRIDEVIKLATEKVHEEAESVNIKMSTQLDTHLKEAKETLSDIVLSRDRVADLVKEIEDKRDKSGKLPADLEKKVTEQVEKTREKKKIEDYTANDWILKGEEAIQNDQYEEAIKYFKNAIKIKPNDIAAHDGFTFALVQAEKYEEAIDTLRTLPATCFTYWGVYFNWDCALRGMEVQNSPLLEAKTEELKEILEKNKNKKELKDDYRFLKIYKEYFPKEK